MTASTSVHHLLIGTAGHIDHGKTRLVAGLTGINTDRLPEEKSRGISIDLGFAHWQSEEFRFGVVDVPGHERFVRNMVAGATGIDIALLVVAADDSVMPQTREHLEIMQLLGIPRGLIAITKTDLADVEMCELVEEEVTDLVADTFLAEAPIIRVSSETGEGIAELREAIVDVARSHQGGQRDWGLFRLPVDRSFSISGHGTVVTGSVICGEVQPGESLELLPQQEMVRVRNVQSHHEQSELAAAHQRTAVNIAGLKPNDVPRGSELVSPGWIRPTRRLLVELQCLSGSPLELKSRLELSLHVGTAEQTARLALANTVIEPGQTGFGELRLKDPVVTEHGQRFILRRISPAVTVAGGRVLDPLVPDKLRLREPIQLCSSLASDSAADRISALLAQMLVVPDDLHELAIRTGCSPAELQLEIDELAKKKILENVRMGRTEALIHRDRFEQLQKAVLREVNSELQRLQPRRTLPRRSIINLCRDLAEPRMLEWLVDRLVDQRQLVVIGVNLSLAGSEAVLTKKQRQLLNRMLDAIHDGGLTPPTIKEFAAQLEQDVKTLQPLLALSVEDGLVLQLDDNLYLDPRVLDAAREQCRVFLEENGPSTLSALREMWGVSRKFAIPLGEFLDARQITVREGDLRRIGPAAEQSLIDGP